MLKIGIMNSLETRLHKSIDKVVVAFAENPFHYFTEADVVADLKYLLTQELQEACESKDGINMQLVHQEYPTFFKQKNVNRRGHYNIVVLNPEFIRSNHSWTIAKPGIGFDPNVKPFLAVVEAKLFYEGIAKNRANAVIKDLNKLESSKENSDFMFYVHFQRYLKNSLSPWKKYWPRIKQAAKQSSHVQTCFTIYWHRNEGKVETVRFGNW